MDSWEQVDTAIRTRLKKLPELGRNFMNQEIPILTSAIAEKFYTTGGDGLNVRSGRARAGWDYSAGFPNSLIFNTVAYADHSEERTIRPVNGQFLAIPIGQALTPSKVAKYTGPRDPALAGRLTVIKIHGKLYLVEKTKTRGGKNGLKFYFALRKSVTIPARTQGLKPWVQGQAQKLVERLGDRIVATLRAP